MKKLINYQWLVNEVDQYGDIIENYFLDSLAESVFIVAEPGSHLQLSLMKYKYNGRGYLIDHAYAEVKEGKIEKLFDDYTEVPDRYRKEFSLYYPSLTLTN